MAKDKSTIGADLEATSNTQKISKHAKVEIPDFTNREFLENESPLPFITDETKSSKFEEEREDNIQKGLDILKTLSLKGMTINPLLILLAKWWECKPARAAVKKMIDEEALSKGQDPVVYLQIILAKEVDVFSEVQTAIDRVRYARTYFKPRKPINAKVITKLVNIDGEVYVVPVDKLEEAKIEFAGDAEKIKQAVIGFSTKQSEQIEAL
jgi:hypothetical protein